MDVNEILSKAQASKSDDIHHDSPSDDERSGAGVMEPEPEPSLEAHSLKRLLPQFERRVTENQQQRIKFHDDPSKFAESETELYANLEELQSLSTQPELFPILVEKNVIKALVGLLAHENVDISCKVLQMIDDYIDEDNEYSNLIVEELIKHEIVDQIVFVLEKLRETVDDEAMGLSSGLSVIENLIEAEPTLAKTSSKELIKWIIKKLDLKTPYHSTRLQAVEILSVLLIHETENRILVGSIKGIDTLLHQVAYYRRHAPATSDEREFIETLFECLCTSILQCDTNREIFVEDEGVELINLILKDRKPATLSSNIKICSLKFLNHTLTSEVTSNPVVIKCCERFIDAFGLRVLFPIFMNPKVIISNFVPRREIIATIDEIEEHSISILLSLLKNSRNVEHILRILIKFIESDFEKVDRLAELHLKYRERVDETRESHEESHDRFTLRMVDYTIVLVAYLAEAHNIKDTKTNDTIKSRLIKCFGIRAADNSTRRIVEEMKTFMESNAGEQERNSIKVLIESF